MKLPGSRGELLVLEGGAGVNVLSAGVLVPLMPAEAGVRCPLAGSEVVLLRDRKRNRPKAVTVGEVAAGTLLVDCDRARLPFDPFEVV